MQAQLLQLAETAELAEGRGHGADSGLETGERTASNSELGRGSGVSAGGVSGGDVSAGGGGGGRVNMNAFGKKLALFVDDEAGD